MTVAADQDRGALENEVTRLGRELWRRIGAAQPGVFEHGFWQGQLLDWAMRDPAFKVQMFRFVDVLPVLTTSDQVARHVREYLLSNGHDAPAGVRTALRLAAGGATAALGAIALRRNVTALAQRFIAGPDPAKALPALRKLRREGLAFTVDLLGEATISNAEADAYQARYLDLIDTLAAETAKWPDDRLLDHNDRRPLPRANVSLKASALEPFADPVDPRGSVERLLQRVRPLLLRARERGAAVNFDLEQWALHGITYDLFERLIADGPLRDWADVGIVVQAYLKSAPDDVDRLLALVRGRGAPLTVRLVKGAYWEYEVVRARQYGYPCPVLMEKAATDAQYERLTTRLLEHRAYLEPAIAGHNLRSIAHALAAAESASVPPSAIELQMLYGMAEPERRALCELGYRVRIYAPVGELLPGMAYLVRRLLENTSNSSFLRLSHHEHQDIGTLLAAPAPEVTAAEVGAVVPPTAMAQPLDTAFINCPLTDFTDSTAHARFTQGVADLRGQLPLSVPVVIAGQARTTGPALERRYPGDTSLVVARVTLATPQDADSAVEACYRAYPAWRDTPLVQRAALLEKLGGLLERDRYHLAGLEVYEVGKPWREADADIAEAIDYCRYYARAALAELAPRRQGSVYAEENLLVYEGRGPTAVIAPWNFPLAILCGMSTAALVAGNPVVLKPAEQSSAVGYALYQRMIEAGFPPEVVHFLPGTGEEVGARLAAHPLVAQVAFTGSMKVGLSIIERAGQTQVGRQPQVKRVFCEMGGKNAIVVDDDADLDEAVAAIITSAFGYAGQKCSACARVLVVGGMYDPLVARLREACRSLIVAPPHEPSCQLPPVVDEEAQSRLLQVIDHPGEGAELLIKGETRAPGAGWFVPAAVFGVRDQNHRLMQEELFGPILAVMPVESFEHALEVALGTPYALTAAVFSRTPSHLDLARRKLRVGNLYLNRACTGAMIGRQPFGGLGMSGLGTKAGGPGYLMQFAEARVVTENTMRRGVTPELI